MAGFNYTPTDLASDLVASALSGVGTGLSTWRDGADHTRSQKLDSALFGVSKGRPNDALTEELQALHPSGFDAKKPYHMLTPLSLYPDGSPIKQVVKDPTGAPAFKSFEGVGGALEKLRSRLEQGAGGPLADHLSNPAHIAGAAANALTAPGGHAVLAPILGMIGTVGANTVLRTLAPHLANRPYAMGTASALGTMGSRLLLRVLDSLSSQ